MLLIGWSKKVVSIEEPINLPGQFHARLSKGVMDPLTINCLVIDDKKEAVIFMSGDFMSVHGGLVGEIREKIKAVRNDIPVETLIFNATHTHCSPCHYKEDILMEALPEGMEAYPCTEYRAYLVTAAAETVIEAFDNRKQGAIAYGYGYAVVSHNRRVTYYDDTSLRTDNKSVALVPHDGHAKMYGNTNDDKFSGYEGGADHFVNLLYTFDMEGALTGAIINVPCPSQISESQYMMTADFWNEVRNTLREKYGDIGIVSQCAAAGDLSPRILHYRAAERRRFNLKYGEDVGTGECIRADISERICAAFAEVLSWARKDLITEAEIKHSVKQIFLEERLITEKEHAYAKAEMERLNAMGFVHTEDEQADFKENSKLITFRSRVKNILTRYESQKIRKEAEAELHVVKIGDIAFATNPYELFIDFQHQIQARSPFTQTFIIQLVGDPDVYKDGDPGFPGYLATEQAVNNRGYSATMYCNRISPKGGSQLVEETLKELKALYES